jgi:hypothetical protein
MCISGPANHLTVPLQGVGADQEADGVLEAVLHLWAGALEAQVAGCIHYRLVLVDPGSGVAVVGQGGQEHLAEEEHLAHR